ncbi:MAG: hypothetical protein ACLGI9_20805 [Thermoanaerobaculia bacterium]
MSGSTLRRTVLCLVVIALLLPLASAWAAPAGGRETPRIQLHEWSRTLLAPLSALLDLFRPAAERASMPPGQKPGNGDGDGPSREGSGLDPHGRP